MRLDTHILLQTGKDTNALKLVQLFLTAKEGEFEPDHILRDRTALREYKKWEKKREEERSISISVEKSLRERRNDSLFKNLY